MKERAILRFLGLMCLFLALALLLPLFFAYYHNENIFLFLYPIIISIISGTVLIVSGKKEEIGLKESMVIVVFAWLLFSILGLIPFHLYGLNFIDSLFETVSGFSTTGASVINDVEILPLSLLLWRSFTHWLGGLGIILLVIAILPSMGGGMQLFRAESTGPLLEKETPKVRYMALILLGVYLLISLLEIFLLTFAGMNWFDAMIHTFGTVATGGFSSKNASIGSYHSLFIEIIIITFMFLASINFFLIFKLLKGDLKHFFFNKEMQFHFGVILVASSLITLNLNFETLMGFKEAIRVSAFNVMSLISTTGFAVSDFNQWPDFSKFILFLLLLIGGCAGSTSGSIKNIRYMIVFKYLRRELKKMVHPTMVEKITIGKRIIDEEVITKVFIFVFLYFSILVFLSLILIYGGADTVTSLSAVAATIGGVGPGFNLVGPASTYSFLPVVSKLALIAGMILGRLEIFSVLLLFMPSFWQK